MKIKPKCGRHKGGNGTEAGRVCKRQRGQTEGMEQYRRQKGQTEGIG